MTRSGSSDELAVLVLDGPARLGSVDPAVVHDEEDVVVHDVVPVGHELLVDVVLIEQRDWLEAGQQVVADRGDQVVGHGLGIDRLQAIGRCDVNQSSTLPRTSAGELLELGGVEDGLLDVADIDSQVAVAGPVGLEQRGAQAAGRRPSSR